MAVTDLANPVMAVTDLANTEIARIEVSYPGP